jgi:ribose/xylose/arabinose/galactoside ABC-type transport system permease subunit
VTSGARPSGPADGPRGLIRALVDAIRRPGYHDSRTIWLVLAGLVVAISLVVPEFIDPRNLENVLRQLVPLGFASLGQLIVIIGGGIDLSIGPLISLTTVLLSHLAGDNPASIALAVAACLAVGGAVGLANGVLAHHARISPLIATLCTGFIVQGIAYAFHQTTGGYVPAGLRQPLTASWGPLSVPFAMYVLAVVACDFLLYRMRFGRWLYALGGNEEVLHAAGVRVARVRIGSYVLAGVLAAIAGIYIAARLTSGSSHYGDGYALTTIAAVVLGGASLAGGEGGLWGAVAGTVIVSMLGNVLNNVSFRFGLESSFYKDVLTGLVLIGAMLFYRRHRS